MNNAWQRVSINDVIFPIALKHSYLFLVTMDTVMDTIMNNVGSKYQ